MAVQISRTGITAFELRRAARRATGPAASRMLAIALVLEGHSRMDAARQCGMDRQTLRDWVHRFNAEGLAGLSNRHGGGPPLKLTGDQEAEVADWIRTGPDLASDGVVRWRLIDLRDRIASRFAVELHERSVGKLARRLGFSRVSVRPRHPDADAEAQAAHKKTSPIWCAMSFRKPNVTEPSNSGGRTRRGLANKAA